MAKSLKMQHYEMSAKTGENVEDLFNTIIDALSDSKGKSQDPMGKIK